MFVWLVAFVQLWYTHTYAAAKDEDDTRFHNAV